jgi:hypothetical protein
VNIERRINIGWAGKEIYGGGRRQGRYCRVVRWREDEIKELTDGWGVLV